MGGGTVEEPEPNGWELLRSINELKDSVNRMTNGMLPLAMFSMYQESVARENQATNERLKKLERASEESAPTNDRLKKLERHNEESRKTRAQQWFSIWLAVVGAVGSLIVGIILK